jgi:hypothetical protein
MVNNKLGSILSLYSPLVGLITALGVMIFLRRRARVADAVDAPTIDVSLWIITLPLPIRRSFILYGFCAAAALGAIIFAATRDYSGFFPTRLKMQVFYDAEGIDRTLKELRLPNQQLRLAKNLTAGREIYYLMLDHEIATSTPSTTLFFSLREAIPHSEGDTRIVVKKVSGWQRYHIEVADGELLHTLERPGLPSTELLTAFSKLDSSDDYIHPSFADIVFRRSFLIRPRFKQYPSARRIARGTPFRATVVGASRISLLPLPSFSNTLYLADVPAQGLVPIGYAVYVEDDGDN